MVYINAKGDVGSKGFSIVEYFWKMVYFIMFFFQALLAPLFGNPSTGYDPDSQARFRSSLRGDGRGNGGGGGGGGSFWNGRPGGGGGGGPRRPMGRLNTSGPSSMPSCPSGGCCR